MHFDHAGIATNDMDGLKTLFSDLFAAPVVHEQTFDGMRVAFLELENGYFELLEPHEGGPIATYLNRSGPGIHHLAIETDDITAAIEHAIECGVEPIDSEPRQGAWGHDVAFMHPKTTGGVLVEFVSH